MIEFIGGPRDGETFDFQEEEPELVPKLEEFGRLPDLHTYDAGPHGGGTIVYARTDRTSKRGAVVYEWQPGVAT